jgi:hypothetical protein
MDGADLSNVKVKGIFLLASKQVLVRHTISYTDTASDLIIYAPVVWGI